MDFFKNLSEIFSHPTTYITLLGILVLLLGIVKMKKVKINTLTTAQIGLALGLTVVLKMFKLFTLPNGGSITLGSMVPIILIALLYGPEIGLLSGFLYGLLDFIMGPYILHPVQVLFDYPLPFMMLGLAGFFANKGRKGVIIGTIAAVFGRFFCHFFAGVVFWGSYAPEGMSPYLYSFLYNGSFLSIDGLICLAILSIIPIKQISSVVKKQHA